MSDSQGGNYYRHLQRDEAISSERLVRAYRCLCLGVRRDAYGREVVGVRIEVHVANHHSRRARSAGTLHNDWSPVVMGIPSRSRPVASRRTGAGSTHIYNHRRPKRRVLNCLRPTLADHRARVVAVMEWPDSHVEEQLDQLRVAIEELRAGLGERPLTQHPR